MTKEVLVLGGLILGLGVAGYTTYAKLKKRSEEQEEYIGEHEEA